MLLRVLGDKRNRLLTHTQLVLTHTQLVQFHGRRGGDRRDPEGGRVVVHCAGGEHHGSKTLLCRLVTGRGG